MGLHIKGFIISILIILPTILLLAFPSRIMPKLDSPSLFITLLERVGQIACFMLPILYGQKIAEQNGRFILVLMGICLALYYIGWLRFFAGGREFSLLFEPLGFIYIPMAVFPMLYFLLLAFWLHSPLFIIAALLFSIGHFINSWSIYQQIK